MLNTPPFTLKPFQEEASEVFKDGRVTTVLVNAPTGSGKSLSAFLAAVSRGTDNLAAHVLWITPLKSLARDLQKSLEFYIQQYGLEWTVALRSGDSTASEKKKQLTKLPTILITTPESISLLLTHASVQKQFTKLALIVADEWHELMGSKRGVQTELCMARLRKLSPQLCTIGLSATIGNTETALAVLHGNRAGGTKIISNVQRKKLSIDILAPPPNVRFPWAGHMGLTLAKDIIPRIRGKISLLFTNTRFQAERWYQELIEKAPDLKIGLHHGSIDKEEREIIEENIKQGKLDLVVCTASLDLGVDFPPVDQVVQIGSPRSVARALQRAGRSGHKPDATALYLLVPTNQWELADFVAIRQLMLEQTIEIRKPMRLCYDVLLQHICTLALAESFTFEEIFAEAKTAHAYTDLNEESLRWIIDFVVTGGKALSAYDSFHRLSEIDGRYSITNKKTALLQRLSIGTIVSDESVSVVFARGGSLGSVEERFIAALKPGDTFVFSGKSLELIQFRDMKAIVRLAKKATKSSPIPRWMGSKMPFSVLLGTQLLGTIEKLKELVITDPALIPLQQVVDIQTRASTLPDSKSLLIESVKFPDEQHLFFYPFLGRNVHEGLALLIAKRLSDKSKLTINYSVNDYGLNLFTKDSIDVADIADPALWSPVAIEADIAAAINLAELIKRHFREVARIAGLIFQGYPGKSKTTKQITISSSLLFDVLRKYDQGNLLIQQAEHEVLEHKLQTDDLYVALKTLEKLPKRIISLERLTPLSFGLWVERLESKLSSEDFKTRVEKAIKALERES